MRRTFLLSTAATLAAPAAVRAQTLPAGAPALVVERLSAAFQKALADPDVRAKLALAALEPLGGTPEDFSHRLRSEGETWLGTARKYGIGRT